MQIDKNVKLPLPLSLSQPDQKALLHPVQAG